MPPCQLALNPTQTCGNLKIVLRCHDSPFLRAPQVPLPPIRARRRRRRLLRRPGIPPLYSAPSIRPLTSTQGLAGVDTGPTALIEAGLLTSLAADLDFHIFHDGAVHSYAELLPAHDPRHRGMKNPRAVSAVARRLAEQVHAHAALGRPVLTLGGDHSIAIGTIAGTARAVRARLGREIAVIWVDAHADINTPETSGSGNVHGMPVAFLTGLARETDESMFGWLGADERVGHDRRGEQIVDGGEGTGAARGPLSLKKLVYIGLRDLDAGEKKILKDHGVCAFTMHDVDKYAPVAPTFPLSFLAAIPSSEADMVFTAGMALGASWSWRWATSGPTRPSTCHLTWMRWTRSGRPARARLCAAASRCARATTSANALQRRAAWSPWIWSRSTRAWRMVVRRKKRFARACRWSNVP